MTLAQIGSIVQDANTRFVGQVAKDGGAPPVDSDPVIATPLEDDVLVRVAFAKADPHKLAMEIHNHWLSIRLKDGWRYSTTFDAGKKEHDYLLSWDDLTDAQRQSYVLLKAICNSFVD